MGLLANFGEISVYCSDKNKSENQQVWTTFLLVVLLPMCVVGVRSSLRLINHLDTPINVSAHDRFHSFSSRFNLTLETLGPEVVSDLRKSAIFCAMLTVQIVFLIMSGTVFSIVEQLCDYCKCTYI